MTMFVNLYVHHADTGEQAEKTLDINIAQVELIRSWEIQGQQFYRLDTASFKMIISAEDYLDQVLPLLYPKECE